MSPTFNPEHYIQLGEEGVDTFYVQDSEGTWQPLNHFEFFRIKKAMNQASEFEVKIYDIQDTEKAYLKRGNYVLFLTGQNVILKGRLQSVEYGTGYECVAKGFGMECLLLDQELIKNGDKRVTYDLESAKTIAEEILSENTDGSSPWIIQPNTTGLFDTDFGNMVLNYENVTRLKALNTLAEAMGSDVKAATNYEWWVSLDDNDYDVQYFNIAPARPTTTRATTSQKTFLISGTSANATNTSKEEDITNMVNSITVLGKSGNTGADDDVNTTTYSASTSFSRIDTEINETVTTIIVEDHENYDADDFVTGGGTIRIADEQITYTAYNAGTFTFTGCTRGANGTTARKHKKGCYVEEYHAQDSPETGSSLDTHGLYEHTVVDKGITDRSEAELRASNILLQRKDPIIKIKINPYEPQTMATDLELGDLVTVTDDEADINDDYRVQSIEYKSDYGNITMIIEVSNRSLNFVEQLNNVKVKADELAVSATGYEIASANIQGNCEGYSSTNSADYPLNMFFYCPSTVAVHQALLTFDITDYRSGVNLTTSAGAAHSHSFSDSGTTGSGSSHTHSFSDTSDGPSATWAQDVADEWAINLGTGCDECVVDHTERDIPTDAHTHDVSGTTGSESSHDHSFTASGTTGNESTHTHTLTAETVETTSGNVAVLLGDKGSEIPIGTASDSGTAEAGGNTTLQDTDKSWGVDDYADYVVYISGGTGSGQTRFISSNTADTLTVAHDWDTNPDATSVYSIYPTFTTSQTNVDVQTEMTNTTPGGSGASGLVNVKFLPKDGDMARIEAHLYAKLFI